MSRLAVRFPLFASIVLMTAALGCSGISKSVTSPASAVPLSASPSALSFSTPTPNTAAQQNVSVQNAGTSRIVVQSISVSGSSAFSVVKTNLPLSLQSGQSVNVAIAFDPSTTGSFNGSLVVASNSADTISVPLVGTVGAPPIAVSMSPAQAVLQVGATQQFTAIVSGTTNKSVSWYVNGVKSGNASDGTVNSSGLYTAPASVPSGGVVSLTAVSAADTTKSAAASVTLAASGQPVNVTISPTSASVQGDATQQFTAKVSGTSNKSVNWLVNGTKGGSSTNGIISSTGVYTAPACPANNTATVTALSAYATSASASAAVSLTPAPLNSTDRYVATNGSDSNDGSACKPWATLQKASSSAKPASTIHIMAGTYSLSSTLSTSNSGTASAPITFVGTDYDLAARNWPVKIVHTGTASTVWAITGAYVTIEGIDLSSNYAGTYNGIKSSAAYTVVKNSHIHNIVNDGEGACVVGGSGSDYYTVVNNEINDCGTSIGATAGKLIHGIYLHGYYSTIQNNLIYRASGIGIQLYSYGVGHPNQEPWHSIITNNTIFYCGKGIIATADQNGFSDYNDIGNNIVAFLVDVNSPSYGIYSSGAHYGTHNTIEYNLVWSVPDARYIGTGLTYTHDVNADPQFVNYQNNGTGDYHLAIGSAGIDAGTPHGAPSIDFEGTVRPQGAAPDIGAYESH